MAQPGDEHEVLAPREDLVDGGELSREADRRADGGGIGCHVAPVDAGAAGIRLHEGREDAHERRLAGAVAAEQGEDAAASHGEVDPAQRVQVAEGLLDARDADRRVIEHRGGHDCSRSAFAMASVRRVRSLSIH